MIEFLLKVWKLARPYKTRLILGLLFSILFAFSQVLLMAVVKIVCNVVIYGNVADLVKSLDKWPQFLREFVQGFAHIEFQSNTARFWIIAALPAVMFFRGLFGYLNVYFMNWAAARAIADLRLRLFDHLQNLSLEFFHDARTGALISRILSDTLQLHSTIATTFTTIIREPVQVIALTGYLFWQHPRLTMISLLVFPVCVVPVVIYGRKVRKSSKALQSHLADLADVMHESFTGNRIVKAYNLEDAVLARFRLGLKNYVSHYMRILRAQETPGPVIEFLGCVGVSFVFTYMLVHSKENLNAGDLLQFMGSIFLLYQPVKYLSRLQNQLEQARAASLRVFEYLETKSTIVEPENPVVLNAVKADIHFDQIDFNYGAKPVLRDINLKVRAGQMVALVGSSGSGKTTMANLLLRFYDPQTGAVRIGGMDIRRVNTKNLRANIALVSQDTILFNDTIEQNIALGRPGATKAEIEAAAKHAHAHDFIIEKPLGYQTMAGEKGVVLSGGQRQRIAIARALLRDAPILILDEAMSALDTESERAVQDALDELMRGRTTICIAHRLSTIQNADVIVVLSEGRIVETGTHTELLAARGVYWKLYELGH